MPTLSRRLKVGMFLAWTVPLLTVSGCSRPPVASDKSAAPSVEASDDALKIALQQFREAKELPHFREALSQISGPLLKQPGKPITPLDDKTRQLVKDLMGLEAAELDEIDAMTMRPLDAAYLESCFLFRDAARYLELPGLARREQALLGFAAAMRQVLLLERQDDGLPPHLVFQRGWGGVRDRALVALELLRQWQFDGCIVAVPGKDGDAALLVGVWATKKDDADLMLFDPRLGLPIPGPKGAAVATLADVRAQPELLKFGGLEPEQFKRAVARWPWPMTSVAPRMKALDEALSGPERVDLDVDIVAWQARLTVAGLPAAPWPSADAVVPARRARLFYPTDDGGLDKGQRRILFMRSLAPLTIIQYQIERMRLVTDELDALKLRLLDFGGGLFIKYGVEPRLALLRGQHEAVFKRVDIVGNVLEQAEFTTPIAEAEFLSLLEDWRQRARKAYLDESVTGNSAKVNEFWNDDQFVLGLLRADPALPLNSLKRGLTSYLVLRACREPLGHQVEWLRAACWEEKALRQQAQAEERRAAGKEIRQADLASAWRNTRSAWARFLDRADMAPAQFPARLTPLAPLWRQGALLSALAIGLAEQLHLDLHRALEARLRQAQANLLLGEKATAAAALSKVRDELAALEKLDEPRKVLLDGYTQVRAETSGPQLLRMELLLRDWGPGGNLEALRQRLDRLLDSLK